MITGIEVGPEVVTSDDSTASPLNVEHSLRGNLVQFPLRDRVDRNAESRSELSLRPEMSKNALKGSRGSVTHIDAVVHRQLRKRNRQLIDRTGTDNENKQMVEMPSPEHYSTFAQWLDAARKSRRLTKTAIAKIGGVKPQAVTKWFKDGDVKPESLRKLSDWSGIDYSKLRLLLEGQPIVEVRGKGPPPPTPTLRRLITKLRVLEEVEGGLHVLETLADTLIEQADQKKRKPG